MTRIDFYFNVTDKQQATLEIVQSALYKRRQVTIFAKDENMASDLSVNLWQNKPEIFLPNVLENHEVAEQTPVVIYWQEKALLQDDMLINLASIELGFFSRFTQLVELVGDNESDKVAARARFKFYRDRGYEIKSIDHAQVKTD
jgi:DNA polymerase-3 subunit chi